MKGQQEYRIWVPRGSFKQWKTSSARTYSENLSADTPKDAHMQNVISKSRERGVEFILSFSETVKALEEYLDVWAQVPDVANGKTFRLILNSEGRPFSGEGAGGFASYYLTRRGTVALNYRKKTGIQLPLCGRYDPRHVVGDALKVYAPGQNLKTIYLTHADDTGTDSMYGRPQMQYLHACVLGVLQGLPPLHEQERIRREEQDAQLKQRLDQFDARLAADKEKDRRIQELETENELLKAKLRSANVTSKANSGRLW
jgi:hypothetical protein